MPKNKENQVSGKMGRDSPIMDDLDKILSEMTPEQVSMCARLGLIYAARLFGGVLNALSKKEFSL